MQLEDGSNRGSEDRAAISRIASVCDGPIGGTHINIAIAIGRGARGLSDLYGGSMVEKTSRKT